LRITRKAQGLSLVVGLATALVGCGTPTSNQSTALASDQTLKFPVFGDFGSLDPAQLNSETDSEIAQNIFNGLVKFDNDLNVVPDIATALPDVSSDKLTYTFKLRKDVTFSNGDKVTSADVLYSWNRGAALQGPYAANLSAVKGYDKVATNTKSGADLETLLEKKDPAVTMTGVTAPDPYTVKVELASAAGWFLSAIALQSTTGMVLDQKVVKTDPTNWWTDPAKLVGTGAFKMTARVPKQSVDFAPVDGWWGSPKPVLKKIHVDILDNPSTGVQKYEQGGYDLDGYGGYSTLPVDDLLRIQKTPTEKAQLLLHPKVRTSWVTFNTMIDPKRPAKGPFAGDLTSGPAHDLRMAFALSIDKAKVADVACHNLICTPATGGLITKGLAGYLGDGADPLGKFDPSKARALLKSADPSGDKTKGLAYAFDPNNPLNKTVADNLQDQWQTNLGVHVDELPVDHSAFIKARCKGSYVTARDGWQADYNHPQDWFDNQWGKLATAGGCNGSGYDSPAFDQLATEADALPLDQAIPKYKQMGKMLSDAVAYVPLYYSVGAFLIKPYVKGAGTNNFFDRYWNEISILQH